MALYFTMMLLALVSQDKDTRKEAQLGAGTRAPTKEEVKEYELPTTVRVQGQVVDSVEPGSPAEKAGIAKGDVILKLGENKIYSRDTIEDFLHVTKPGTEITVLIKRAKSFKEEEIKLKLGEREVKGRRFAWDYASLEQLEQALAQAKKDGKKVLVGLSGAET
jgi:S1-C subfamily serine protease